MGKLQLNIAKFDSFNPIKLVYFLYQIGNIKKLIIENRNIFQ